MALYTRESVERVKEAVDMVELVGGRTDLRRVGGRYTGLCPFHDERTPSFSVNPELRLYHCFGCGESGDAIRFVEKTEALDFPQAVELIADRYGVELVRETEDPRAEERRRRRERLLGLVERAAEYYARFLWESGEAEGAREYLRGRGLADEVLREFRIGYAPSAWDTVSMGAQRDGFRPEEILAAGLAQRGRQGGIYDRFRARIVFPLADARGRVLGFGARALRESQKPKYLNSSENELYHKGRQLFGIDRARPAAAKTGRIVVVEGYTDVLALHGAGIRESVAIMGTAMTPDQLGELSRVAGTVFLALDADRSGQEAMLRASQAAKERRVELRVVGMPEGTDPAELVLGEGPEAFRGLLDSALSVPEFQVRRVIADGDTRSARGRDATLERVGPLIAATAPNSAIRDDLVRYVADKLDVPDSYLMAQLTDSPPQATSGSGGAAVESSPGGRRPASVERTAAAERAFIAMCLAEPASGREYLGRLRDEHLSSPPLRAVRAWLVEHFDEPLAEPGPDDRSAGPLVAEVAMLAEQEPSSKAGLELGFLQLELRRIERELRGAAEAGDFERQRSLWANREDVRREISRLMGETG